MKRALRLLIWFLMVPALLAQEDTRSIIRAIETRNMGAGQIDPSYISSHTRMREGDRLDRALIGRDVRRLLDTGHFTSVHLLGPPEILPRKPQKRDFLAMARFQCTERLLTISRALNVRDSPHKGRPQSTAIPLWWTKRNPRHRANDNGGSLNSSSF